MSTNMKEELTLGLGPTPLLPNPNKLRNSTREFQSSSSCVHFHTLQRARAEPTLAICFNNFTQHKIQRTHQLITMRTISTMLTSNTSPLTKNSKLSIRQNSNRFNHQEITYEQQRAELPLITPPTHSVNVIRKTRFVKLIIYKPLLV